MTIGMMTVASASNGEVVKKIIIPAKTEIVVKQKMEDIKTVTCTVYSGQGATGWSTYSYSCFFCWGGSRDGCIAAAAEYYGLTLP